MSGPSDKIAEAIMMLMQQGGRRGLPMEASPELQQYLRQVQGSAPNAESFDSPNVDLMPQRMTPEDMYSMNTGVEMPPSIGQDPWFDQQNVQSPEAAQMRQMMMEFMDNETVAGRRPAPPPIESFPAFNGGGTWYLKIRDSRGNIANAAGPFSSELEAHRARQQYAKETGRDPSRFIVEQDGV
jgi:hypothetical protein